MFGRRKPPQLSLLETGLRSLSATPGAPWMHFCSMDYDPVRGPDYAPHWSPRQWLAHLTEQPISGSLIDELTTIEDLELSDSDLLQVLTLRKAFRQWAEGRELKAAQRLAGEDRPKDAQHDELVGEYSALYKMHPRTAIGHVMDVRESHRLPELMKLLEQGRISRFQVSIVATETNGLSDAAAAQVDAGVAERAAKLSNGETRNLARKLAMEADPERAEKQARVRRKHADVTVVPHSNGDGADLIASGPAHLIKLMMAAINARAGLAEDDNTTTAGRRRFDALLALIEGGFDKVLACNHCGQVVDDLDRGSKRRRARTTVSVTIPSDTLLGDNDAPGYLEGFGPIAASEARAMALREGTTLRRLIYDPLTGVAQDLDRKKYRLSRAEADFLALRDGVCTAPGCGSAAATCESDHRLEVAGGGETTWEQLQSLCNASHDIKTQHGWSAEESADGGTTWISPLGGEYEKPPRDFRTSWPVAEPVPF